MKKFLIVASCVLAGVVAPLAQGKNPHTLPVAPAQACSPLDVAYVAYGRLVTGSLIANSDGSYSGALTVAVKHANEHARADVGVDTAFTIDHARLKLHGQDPAALAVGSRVRLIGRIMVLPKRCDAAGLTPVTVIQRGFIKAAR
jgi:hypothetical protein